MKAAAAARIWWAALRPRFSRPSGRGAGTTASPLNTAASQISSYVLMAMAAAMVICSVIGFTVALRADRYVSAGQHAALPLALDDMQYVAGDKGRLDDGQVAAI